MESFVERIKSQTTKRITLDIIKCERKLFCSLIRTIKRKKKRCHQIITVTNMVVSNLPRRQGRLKCVSVLMEFFFWTPARGGRSKNLYTKSKTLTLTWSLIWACCEMVNLQNGQNKTSQKHVQHSLAPVICTGLPHHFLLSALPVWHEVAWFRIYSY